MCWKCQQPTETLNLSSENRRGSYGSIAAVTRRVGTADGATRIVINPEAAQLASRALQAVLEHEMVHVATRSPDSPAPIWAEEGLAEWVSTQAHPGQPAEAHRRRAHSGARLMVPRGHFPPIGNSESASRISSWPTPRLGSLVATSPTGTQQTRLGRLYAELDRGRSLDEASRVRAQDQ